MPPSALRLTRKHLETIVSQARDRPFEEVCGLLGGQGGRVRGVFPVSNNAPTPETRFLMDDQSFIDAYFAIEKQGWELVAIYHSHPVGARSEPSQTDIADAAYPDALNLIVSFGRDGRSIVRAFHIGGGQAREVSVEIVVDQP